MNLCVTLIHAYIFGEDVLKYTRLINIYFFFLITKNVFQLWETWLELKDKRQNGKKYIQNIEK